VADHLWFMTRIREEEEEKRQSRRTAHSIQHNCLILGQIVEFCRICGAGLNVEKMRTRTTLSTPCPHKNVPLIFAVTFTSIDGFS